MLAENSTSLGCVVFLGLGGFLPVSRYGGYRAASEILRGVQGAGGVRIHLEGTCHLLGRLAGGRQSRFSLDLSLVG